MTHGYTPDFQSDISKIRLEKISCSHRLQNKVPKSPSEFRLKLSCELLLKTPLAQHLPDELAESEKRKGTIDLLPLVLEIQIRVSALINHYLSILKALETRLSFLRKQYGFRHQIRQYRNNHF